jgi:hypothetical protein
VSGLSLVLTPVILLTSMAIGPFLQLWLGRDIGTPMIPVALLLLAGIWIDSLAMIANAKLLARDRARVPALIHAAQVIPYLLSWWLLTHLGIAGAALAWTIRMTVQSALLFLAGGGRQTFVRLLPTFLVIAACSAVPLRLAGIQATLVQLPIALFGCALAYAMASSGSRASLHQLLARVLRRPVLARDVDA